MVVPGRKPLSDRVEADETLVGGAAARQARPRRCGQDGGRRRGRGRRGQGARSPARPAAAAGGARRLGQQPGRLSSAGTCSSPAAVATDGWAGYRGLEAEGYAHEPIPLARSWGDAALRLPAIHLVFGLAKRWLLGTHHGAVSAKHLQAYLDEYVFRFNRRTAKSIGHRFARLIEQAVLTPPTTYRAITHGSA